MSRAPVFPKPQDDNEYFEHMLKGVFISGFSRKVVMSKWGGFREIFEQFDFRKVATWKEPEIMQAASSTKIVRNQNKIESAVYNAQQIIKVVEEYGSMATYIAELTELGHDKRVKALAKRFKWLGTTGSNIFLIYSGEIVPGYND